MIFVKFFALRVRIPIKKNVKWSFFWIPPSSQYKQIGNAVPVNLAHAMGRKLILLLNNIEKFKE